uniref:TNFR-Cys domain-containing protein n=1 Tax=Neogobius melanostomus TaxID=47308 RepID=A0A8C6T415_9GOBI
MFWSLTGLGNVFLLLPALSCRPEEYAAQDDGQCCPMCREGTVVIGHCTEDSGTRCRPCANGTYMNQPNGETRCFLCSICHSAHGLLALLPCSSVSNSVCGAKPGFFCQQLSEGGSCEAAQKHSSCSPGQRVKEPGTSSADTVCEDCPEETFSLQGTNCTAWTRYVLCVVVNMTKCARCISTFARHSIYPSPDREVMSDPDRVCNHTIGPDFQSLDRIGTSLVHKLLLFPQHSNHHFL